MSHPKNNEIIGLVKKYSTHHYEPLPVVVAEAEGVWLKDVEGKQYLDMISSSSSLTCGHRHQRIINALKRQTDRVTLTSNLLYNDQLIPCIKKLTEITGKDMALMMNTGTEAVEAAIKCARRWGYSVKNIPKDKAEVIACAGNFHGSTITLISFSTNEECFKDFSPYTPGFKVIPFGNIDALREAISPNTAAFLVEPIQGHAGIVIPPDGFLREAYKCCKKNNVLFLADEIQTGLGRTGKWFACDWEDIKPDIYILGKALGGGVVPVSAIVANSDVLELFDPGSSGTTYGGNPLACVCAKTTLEVIEEENLPGRSYELGSYFLAELSKIKNADIKEVRGKGLYVALEFYSCVDDYFKELIKNGILCSKVGNYILRFIPPLVISKEELDWALNKIVKIIKK